MERCYWMEGAKSIRRIFETQILLLWMLPDSKYNVIVYKYFQKDYGIHLYTMSRTLDSMTKTIGNKFKK